MKLTRPTLAPNQKHVIIVGAGFAGLNAAKIFAGHEEVHVTLIDQRNHHLFQPLLYQVATAGLDPSEIAAPIRAQFSRDQNVYVHLGRVGKVNLTEKWIEGETNQLRIPYDFLVLASGAQHSYFGNPEWEADAPGLKTLEQALEIRRRILLAFELAENELDPEKQKSLLTFVVVGAGPTGMELAGAISDIARTVLVKDFRRIDPAAAKVLLVEAGPRILPSFDEKLAERAAKDLAAMKIEVRVNTKVAKINAEGVEAGTEWIDTRNVFWAAGVQASRPQLEPEQVYDRAGRVMVTKNFGIPGAQGAFAIGDLAAYEIEEKKFLPGLAPAAIQAGKYVANVILAECAGKPHKPFRYVDKGQMATIGKHRAIAMTGKLRLTGYVAWLAWLFVHIFYLVGFTNRLAVLIRWTWSYLFSKRGSRLITNREWRLPKQPTKQG
jgi:NADH dehydrogenase